MSIDNFKAYAPVHPEHGIDFKRVRATEREVHPLVNDKMEVSGWIVRPVFLMLDRVEA